MRRRILGALIFILLLVMSGCSKNTERVIVNTFEQTPSEQIQGLIEDAKEVIIETYYEMNNGTWKTDDHTYQYKLVVTGRLNNAVRDTSYTILSNIEDITFEQAWKASGLSSNLDDYFKIEEAVFVAIK